MINNLREAEEKPMLQLLDWRFVTHFRRHGGDISLREASTSAPSDRMVRGWRRDSMRIPQVNGWG